MLKKNLQSENRIYAYALPVLLVLINGLVKGLFLGTNSLGGDEPFSVYVSQMEVVPLVKYLSTGNNPPLFEILLHYWIRLAGISEFAVRIPSLIFSCVTVWFIYRIGRKHFNIRIAIYSCCFFIFSNFQITYAHEARVYALMGMLTAMSMYYFLEIVSGAKSKAGLAKAGFILVNILLIYAHYFGFFVLLIQAVHILLNRELRKKHLRFLILGGCIILAAYSPNIPVLYSRFTDSAGVGGTWLTPPTGVVDLYNMLWKFTNKPLVAGLSIVLLFTSLVLAVVRLRKGSVWSPRNKLVASWFLLPFLGMFFISYWTPIFLDRYLMFVSIGFCFLLALAADSLIQKRSWQLIIPGVFCVLFLATMKPNLDTNRNVREVVRITKALQKNDQTLVLFCPHHFCLNVAYYYDREVFMHYNPMNIYKPIDQGLNKYSVNGTNDIHEVNLDNWNRVIFLDAASNFSYPNNGIFNKLQIRFRLKKEVRINEIFVIYEFEREL